jgi:hypothetical protein
MKKNSSAKRSSRKKPATRKPIARRGKHLLPAQASRAPRMAEPRSAPVPRQARDEPRKTFLNDVVEKEQRRPEEQPHADAAYESRRQDKRAYEQERKYESQRSYHKTEAKQGLEEKTYSPASNTVHLAKYEQTPKAHEAPRAYQERKEHRHAHIDDVAGAHHAALKEKPAENMLTQTQKNESYCPSHGKTCGSYHASEPTHVHQHDHAHNPAHKHETKAESLTATKSYSCCGGGEHYHSAPVALKFGKPAGKT